MSIEWFQYLDLSAVGKHESEELPAYLFYTYLCVSILCVCMAGMMSGLTLGFFSLDEIDLEVSSVTCLSPAVTDKQLASSRQLHLLSHLPLCCLLL
jgi:hypothetical protein